MTSDQDLTADVTAAVDAVLARRLADAQRRRERQKADRTRRAARRTAGLRARHATKLTRGQNSRSNPWTSPQPTDPSNCPHRTGDR